MLTSHADARTVPAIAGTVATGLAVGVTELAAGLLPGGASPFVAVAGRIIELTPGPVVELAISVFGGANRLVLLLCMAVGLLAAGALLGIGAAARRWLGPAGLGGIATLGIAAGLAAPAVPALVAVAAPAAGWGLGAGLLLVLLARSEAGGAEAGEHAGDQPDEDHAGPDEPERPRRSFLAVAGAGAVLAVASAGGGRYLQLRAAARRARTNVRLARPATPLPPPPGTASFDIDGLASLVTPNEDFYRIDTAVTVPRLDADSHTVRVTGMVDTPLEIGYRELVRAADTEADVTLACVSNEVGGSLVGNARWQGVPLADVLDRAGVHPEATQIVGRATDGWTAGFPVEAAYDGRPALVAVGMNGEPLPEEHGFPARLVIAGLYGYVSDTKWLAEIELTTFEAYDAYWIPRGWAERAPIKTQSRIDVPREGAELNAGTVTVAGVAWAGVRGVEAVEVAVDGGDWREARLAGELARTTWRQWAYEWDATPGQHRIQVRATDGTGRTQTGERSGTIPDGATGHHTIEVTVTR
ncbi:molybdopterin-dependent oxidoreductase [Haloechinothrix sp. YIM 98757]|uniref:Molybdopterin-dependent oxidoreductase n=1 Tax=Haloechinothrix aidingensis TaxID=2752311 RepID=A0A837ZW05_9PSEU|nr:molybdopterin-dependent oxidoreductase [Haloechinothrix aidingensis]